LPIKGNLKEIKIEGLGETGCVLHRNFTMDISRTDFHQALERVVQLALYRNDTLSDLPVVKVNHDFVQAESQLLNTPLPEKGQALNDIFSSVYDTVLKDAPNANGPRYRI
jgi:hypothetical protein